MADKRKPVTVAEATKAVDKWISKLGTPPLLGHPEKPLPIFVCQRSGTILKPSARAVTLRKLAGGSGVRGVFDGLFHAVHAFTEALAAAFPSRSRIIPPEVNLHLGAALETMLFGHTLEDRRTTLEEMEKYSAVQMEAFAREHRADTFQRPADLLETLQTPVESKPEAQVEPKPKAPKACNACGVVGAKLVSVEDAMANKLEKPVGSGEGQGTPPELMIGAETGPVKRKSKRLAKTQDGKRQRRGQDDGGSHAE